MRANNKRSLQFLLFLFLVVSVMHDSADAGILKWLAKAGQEAGEAGTKLGRKIDDVLPRLSHLPDEPNVARMGLDVDTNGSVTLHSENGKKWVVRREDDLPSTLEEIYKQPLLMVNGKPRQLKFYLSVDQLFDNNGTKILSRIDGLHLLAKNKAYPLERIESFKPYWRVNVQDDLFLNFETREALEEGLWRLKSGFNKGNIRLISFLPETKELPNKLATNINGSQPSLTKINPDSLDLNFNILRHQTLIITGKRAGRFLEIKGINRKKTSVDLNELQETAKKHDINLIILESNSSAQPGSKVFPWNRSVRQTELEKAFSSDTYGDFISTLSGRNKTTIEFDQKEGNFVSFRLKPDRSPDTVDSVMTATEVTSHLVFSVGKIIGHTRDHDREIDRRIFPGIPSWVHISYIINIISGLLVASLSVQVWRKIWPKIERDDFNTWWEFVCYYLVRSFLFMFVFLGLLGSLLLIAAFIITVFNFLMVVLKTILWPFRLVGRVFSSR